MVCQVHVTGLPSRLLSEAMLEAMVEQAGVDEAQVLGLKAMAKEGALGLDDLGDALVSFTNCAAAERFRAHMEGCRWGHGAQVMARTLLREAKAAPRRDEPVSLVVNNLEVKALLNKEAPAFIHLSSPLEGAAAPYSVGAAVASLRGAGKSAGPLVPPTASEASTEVGESEAEMERDSPRRAAAGAARRLKDRGVAARRQA